MAAVSLSLKFRTEDGREAKLSISPTTSLGDLRVQLCHTFAIEPQHASDLILETLDNVAPRLLHDDHLTLAQLSIPNQSCIVIRNCAEYSNKAVFEAISLYNSLIARNESRALGAIEKIIENIACNPSDMKFRSLKIDSGPVSRLKSINGFTQLLLVLGFARLEDRLILAEHQDLTVLHKLREYSAKLRGVEDELAFLD
eukprot:TRINITY_DN9515_c0_g2_i3.p1 TRINITY_DN9515_c0_g2~~TRINITY_DN9515_c0_g2_i3.p1  ORF type:complete len:216 (+),score=5.86 TRINITY_DN9515_c0_g2_i3:54-650(+)